MTTIPTPRSLFERGKTLQAKGQMSEARQAFRDAGRLSQHGPILLDIGHAIHACGDLSGAISIFRRATTLDRSLVEAHEQVGALLLEIGGAPAAARSLASAIAYHPDVAVLRYRLAEALAASGQMEDAYIEAETAKTLDSSSTVIDQLFKRLQEYAPMAAVIEVPHDGLPPSQEGNSSPATHMTTATMREPFPTKKEIVARDATPSKTNTTQSCTAITSDLSEFQLPELLQLLVLRRATGHMEVYSGNHEGVIGLDNGCIVHSWNSQAAHLHTYLVQSKTVTPHSLDEFPNKSTDRDAAVATVLKKKGLLSEEKIQAVLRARITESLKTMMTWTVGYSSFVRTDREKLGDTLGIELDTQWAVFEAFRQLEEEKPTNV